jgi:hypothetical protein
MSQTNYTALPFVKKADKSFATLACDAATGHMTGPSLRVALAGAGAAGLAKLASELKAYPRLPRGSGGP